MFSHCRARNASLTITVHISLSVALKTVLMEKHILQSKLQWLTRILNTPVVIIFLFVCSNCRCSGTVGAIATCPLEVLKTRFQSSGLTLRPVFQVQLGTLNGTGVIRPGTVTPGLLQVLRWDDSLSCWAKCAVCMGFPLRHNFLPENRGTKCSFLTAGAFWCLSALTNITLLFANNLSSLH